MGYAGHHAGAAYPPGRESRLTPPVAAVEAYDGLMGDQVTLPGWLANSTLVGQPVAIKERFLSRFGGSSGVYRPGGGLRRMTGRRRARTEQEPRGAFACDGRPGAQPLDVDECDGPT
jgi:hypothetical protein